eukprot:scaffold12529_cov117-Skeletonema_dohrnii-CCMP3373.AAC.1
MKRQRQQHSLQRQRSSVTSTPSWLLLAAALTIPTLLHAFAPNTAMHSKRSVQHHSVQDLHVQRHTQVQPSTLVSTPLSFLARTSATTSMSKLFARGPGRPSAASLEEEEDDDLGFEDEEDAEEVEAEEVFDDLIEIGDVDDDEEEEEEEIFEEEDVDDEEFDIQMEGDEEYYDEEEGYVEEEEEDESSVSTDIWASYDAINEDSPVPLMDDPESNTNYQLAKQSVLAQIEARKQVDSSDFQPAAGRTFQDILNGMTDEEREELERDVDLDEVEALLSRNNMMLTAADRDELSSFDLQELDDITSDENGILSEKDLKKIIIEGEDGTAMIDPKGLSKAKTFEDMSLSEKDLKDLVTKDSDGNNVINPKTLADEFPSGHFNEDEGKVLFPKDNMFTEKDLEDLDDQLTAFKTARERLANQTFYGEDHTMAYMDIEKEWPLLSNQTQEEILEVMENSNTMACPEPENWLVYDLNFNVTNLILASFKHNGEAPIMFTQWMPQLEVYERYASQRAKNFEWTWDDVEQADMDELKRYYKGIGYDHIPTKNPGETGVITLDTSPMDDEEREMLALENWMDEVYNEESDNLLFDDENFEPRDNVFDPDYGTSSSDKSSAIEEKFMKEYDAFEREFSEESQEWRDQFATVERFEYREDLEGQEKFRGHLVVAITPTDEDMEIAEKISSRFKEEFDKAVFVETRVLGHARPEDNVFEVWLESFEIDLLHSKRQAFINSKLWTGPSEVDDKQLDYLVEQVRYLISDDSRYSYRMSDFTDIKL